MKRIQVIVPHNENFYLHVSCLCQVGNAPIYRAWMVTERPFTVAWHLTKALFVFSLWFLTHLQDSGYQRAPALLNRVNSFGRGSCIELSVSHHTLFGLQLTPSCPLQFYWMSHFVSPWATQQLTVTSLAGISYPVYKQKKRITPPTHTRFFLTIVHKSARRNFTQPLLDFFNSDRETVRR